MSNIKYWQRFVDPILLDCLATHVGRYWTNFFVGQMLAEVGVMLKKRLAARPNQLSKNIGTFSLASRCTFTQQLQCDTAYREHPTNLFDKFCNKLHTPVINT